MDYGSAVTAGCSRELIAVMADPGGCGPGGCGCGCQDRMRAVAVAAAPSMRWVSIELHMPSLLVSIVLHTRSPRHLPITSPGASCVDSLAS